MENSVDHNGCSCNLKVHHSFIFWEGKEVGVEKGHTCTHTHTPVQIAFAVDGGKDLSI